MPCRGDEVTRTRRTGYERDRQNTRTVCAALSLLALIAAAAREPGEPGLALRSLRPGEALPGRADVSRAPWSARRARETCTTHTQHAVDKWPQSCDERSHRPRTCHPRCERVEPLRESNTF